MSMSVNEVPHAIMAQTASVPTVKRFIIIQRKGQVIAPANMKSVVVNITPQLLNPTPGTRFVKVVNKNLKEIKKLAPLRRETTEGGAAPTVKTAIHAEAIRRVKSVDVPKVIPISEALLSLGITPTISNGVQSTQTQGSVKTATALTSMVASGIPVGQTVFKKMSSNFSISSVTVQRTSTHYFNGTDSRMPRQITCNARENPLNNSQASKVSHGAPKTIVKTIVPEFGRPLARPVKDCDSANESDHSEWLDYEPTYEYLQRVNIRTDRR